MTKKEFIKGTPAYIFGVDSRINPNYFYIDEVEIESYDGDGYGSVWHWAGERSLQVETKNVYHTYDEAKKALIKFLLNMLKEYTLEDD